MTGTQKETGNLMRGREQIRHILLPKNPHIPDYVHEMSLRPIWRGRLHAVTLFLMIPLTIFLIMKATPAGNTLPAVIYSLSLLAVLSLSSAYHLLARTETSQIVMQRIDRAMIYVLIAGTYTPVLLIVMNPPASLIILGYVWTGALVGVILRALGKYHRISVLLYVLLGWTALIILPALWGYSPFLVLLLVIGGVCYTAGAVLYHFRVPALAPNTFGYHEMFHALTLGGMIFHYIAVFMLVT